ncbi:MAG: hypothetical protein ACK2UW_09145 [Anaerolineales bacterium]|jgi:hypothetical protein
MAKKIRDTSTHSGDTDKSEMYPWLRLLELEVHPKERATPRRGPGRPPSPFPRKAVHVTLTEDELESLDRLSGELSDHLGVRLHRGHLIAFMTFYLRSHLEKGDGLNIPKDITSLTDLALYLDELKLNAVPQGEEL